jgi:DNA (cytosine-5)-methyltransferase 1
MTNSNKTFSFVDLFAGVGGFSQGFLRVNESDLPFNFAPKLLVDSDETAGLTFKKNFPYVPFWVQDLYQVEGGQILNLTKMKRGELDFLIGGPPCQGFSTNGKRWLEDNRNKLMRHFVEIAKAIQPKCVIIENVPTALSAWQKIFDDEIQEAFSGYKVETAVLNASAFGVPQIRKRAFIVAFREDLGVPKIEFPRGEYNAIEAAAHLHKELDSTLRFVSVEEAIGDLPALKAGKVLEGDKTFYRHAPPPTSEYQKARRAGSLRISNHSARAHSEKFLEKISIIKPGEGNSQLSDEERFSDNYYSQAYARLHAKGIGFTVTAHFRNPGSGRFTHYRDNRSITVREAARLQSFDDKFCFHATEADQERHVGNAVPPLLAEALAKHFGKIISLL